MIDLLQKATTSMAAEEIHHEILCAVGKE